MTNEEYWAARMAKAQNTITDMNVEELERVLKGLYRKASKSVIKSFAETYSAILEQIFNEEIEPSPALLYKLDTYWEFQQAIKDELKKMGDKEIDAIQKAFVKEFQSVYEGISWKSQPAFSTIDKNVVTELVNSVWCADGKSWSTRVWGDIDRLKRTLDEQLISSLMTGKTTGELKVNLMKRFNVSFKEADKLVRTEMAHIQCEAARKRYEEAGLKEVQVWADEDERRCEHCGELHMKKYNINEPSPVPVHPNCRCCILPVVPMGLDEKQQHDVEG